MIELRPTGFREIDQQHFQLLQSLEELLAWIDRGYTLGATFNALQAVADYTATHFSFEEDFLRQQGYPKLAEHIAEHQAIIAQIGQLQDDLHAGKDIAEELARTLQKWIVDHILVEDMEYSEFIGPQAE